MTAVVRERDVLYKLIQVLEEANVAQVVVSHQDDGTAVAYCTRRAVSFCDGDKKIHYWNLVGGRSGDMDGVRVHISLHYTSRDRRG